MCIAKKHDVDEDSYNQIAATGADPQTSEDNECKANKIARYVQS